MPTYNERAAQFAAEESVSTTDTAGTIGKIGVDVGFIATFLRLINDKASPVYLDLSSTAGSTGGHKIVASSFIELHGTIRLASFSLASTATTTGDFVRILAVG